MADQNIDPKELLELGKHIKQNQGDFNDLLKDSITNLSKIAKSYDAVLAKIDSMNRGQINTKKIQKELEAAETRLTLSKKTEETIKSKIEAQNNRGLAKVRLYEITQAKVQKQEALLNRTKLTGTLAEIEAEQRKLGLYYDALDASKAMLEPLETAYLLQKNATIQANETKNSVKEMLNDEKKLASTLGIYGNTLNFISKKFGILTGYSEKVVEATRDGNTEELTKLKLLTAGVALYKTLKYIAKLAGAGLSKAGGVMAAMGGPDAAQNISKLTSGFSGLLKNIPFLGGILGGMVDLMSGFVDFVINATSGVQKLGRELGLNASQAVKLNNEYSNFANNSNNVLLNSRKMFETQIELGKQLGVINLLSKERIETDILLKDIAGIELDSRAALVETAVILNKNQKDILNSVFAQVEGLKKVTGIQFNQKGILSEVTKLGGYLGLSFAKYPGELTKSLVTIKAMGMDLKQLDSIADSFLDFESSITNEMEAQVLTGKSLNLNKARELFLNNDLAGAALEINKQVGSANDFLSMNRIQAESIAKAFGMTRDVMGDMLKKQEYMSMIGAKDTDNARTQYKLALLKYGSQEKMVEMMGEETTQALLSANANESIAAFIEKIKQGFTDIVANSGISQFIDKAIKWVSNPENIQYMISKIQGFFASVLDVAGAVTGGIMRFLNYLPGINIDQSLIDMVEQGGSSIRGFSLGALPAGETVGANAARSMTAPGNIAPSSNKVSTVSTEGGVAQNININLVQDGQSTASTTIRVLNKSITPQMDKQTGIG